jgi:hypothetical protein
MPQDSSLREQGRLRVRPARATRVRIGSRATLTPPKFNFRSTLVSGHRQIGPACPFRAKRGSNPDSRRRETAIVRHIEDGAVKPLPG